MEPPGFPVIALFLTPARIGPPQGPCLRSEGPPPLNLARRKERDGGGQYRSGCRQGQRQEGCCQPRGPLGERRRAAGPTGMACGGDKRAVAGSVGFSSGQRPFLVSFLANHKWHGSTAWNAEARGRRVRCVSVDLRAHHLPFTATVLPPQHPPPSPEDVTPTACGVISRLTPMPQSLNVFSPLPSK